MAYEVQTYQRGEWQIDSIANDRESAMESARDFERSKHCAGVRVIEEFHDEDSQKTDTRIVYRYQKNDGAKPQPAQRPRPAVAAKSPGAKPKPKAANFKPTAYAAPAKRDHSTTFAVGTLLVLGLALAVGYMIAIR